MKYKIGFIGAGTIGSALARAACLGIGGENVIVAASSAASAKARADEIGCGWAGSSSELASSSEYVVLAVKPYMIRDVIREIAPALRDSGHVLVSVAAGVTISAMAACLDFELPIIRTLPNTPCSIGNGLTLLSADFSGWEAKVSELCDILRASGEFAVIPEEKMDAGCVASGCSPAYAYMFIDALAEGVEQGGLSRDEALRFSALAVRGAAELLLTSGKAPSELVNAVCTPGGSTVQGVNALEQANLRGIVAEAVRKAYLRNVEMGK